MPEELPNLGVEPLPPPKHSVRASERTRAPFALTVEKARDLYPHLFSYPGYAEQFDQWAAAGKTPEQIGKNILKHDAQWRRDRRKHLDTKYASLPLNDRREIVTRLITEETTPGRPSKAKTFFEGTKEEFRRMRETTGGLAERAVGRTQRLARRMSGEPEGEPTPLEMLGRDLSKGFGAELPLLPFELAAGRGILSAAGKFAPAAVNALRGGPLLKRALAAAGLTMASEAPVTPLATATTPEGMEETALQRLLMAGLFGGGAPVAGAAARGLIGAAERGLARAVPVRQLDVSGIAPRPLQASEAEEIAEAIARLRNRGAAPTSPGRPPPEVTARGRGAGFEQTTPGRPPVTVRERVPATGDARAAMLQAQRVIREVTQNQRVADLMPSERSLAEAIQAQGLDPTAPGAPVLMPEVEPKGIRFVRDRNGKVVFAVPDYSVEVAEGIRRANAKEEIPTVEELLRRARNLEQRFGEARPRDISVTAERVVPPRGALPSAAAPFDSARLVSAADTAEVAAAVREVAEKRYQRTYDWHRKGGVPPREAAHRATQAAEAAARLQRQDAATVARLQAEISADEAAAQAARPGITAAAKASRAANQREAVAILGRTVTPEIRTTAAEAAAAMRVASQSPRTLGQKKRSLAKALERMAARIEGEADVPKARTPRPPGPMGRVRNLEKRLEQDRVDRILQEYMSPAEISTPRPIPGPPPAVPPPLPSPPPPPSPEVSEVLTKIGRFFELNEPTGIRGILRRMRDYVLGPGQRGPPEVMAAFNALRGAKNAGRLNATFAMHRLNKRLGGRPRTNAELWTPDSPALAKELQATRKYIDDNSREIVAELRAAGRPPEDPLIKTIEEHIGTYVRRQYAPWRPPDRLLKPAIKLLLDDNVRAAESGGRLLNGDEIAATIYEMAKGNESVSLVGQKFGRLNLSLIKKRTDIPGVFRAVMGEIEGLPAVGITIADQERFLGTLQFHRKLHSLGYFGTAPDTARGWTRQLPGNPGPDPWANEWTAESIQSLGVLAGKWTTPEIYSGLAETAARENEILQWVGATSGLWRAGKLIALPPIMHNFYGNAGHAVTAGTLAYNPFAQISDLAVAAVELRRYATRGIGERGGWVDWSIRDGVLDAEMATSEFRPALDMFIKAAQRRIEGGGSEALIALAEGSERLAQLGFKAFDFPDQLWKLDAYMKTVRRIRMQLPRATDAEVRQRAARHVLNYFPDYGGVGKGVKVARALGGLLFNQFVSYQANWARILGGIAYRSAAGTPAERADAIGAAVRLAGFTGLMVGIAALMQRMHGLNAAEVAALSGRPGGAVGAKSAALAVESIRQNVLASKPISFIWAYRDARGRPQMVDMTYFHPFGDWFKHYPGESVAGRVLNAAADHFLAPHIAKMFVSPIAEEMGAEPGFERPDTLQNLYAFAEPRLLLSARRGLEKAFGPGARLGFMPPAFPRTDQPTAGQMFMSEVLGIPVTPVGDIEAEGADIEEKMQQMEPRRVNRRLGRDERFTEEQVDEEIERAEKRARLRRMR